MGKVSVKENKNIYQITREELGLSRAAAAELMINEGMTEYRLVKIEDESVTIQPEDIYALSKGYNAPHLCNHYCSKECRIGQEYVPEVKLKDNIHEIVVNMVVSLDTMNSKKARLMEILADGKIGEDEMDDFIFIQKELDRISLTVEALQLWCEKMMGEGKIDKEEYKRRKGMQS